MSFVVGLDLKVTKPEESKQNILFCSLKKNFVHGPTQLRKTLSKSVHRSIKLQKPLSKSVAQSSCQKQKDLKICVWSIQLQNKAHKSMLLLVVLQSCFLTLLTHNYFFSLRPRFCTTYSKNQIFHTKKTECKWGLSKLEDSGFLGFTKPCLQMVMMVLAHNKYAPLIWMQLLHQQLLLYNNARVQNTTKKNHTNTSRANPSNDDCTNTSSHNNSSKMMMLQAKSEL